MTVAFAVLSVGSGLLAAATALPLVGAADGVVSSGEELYDALPDELVSVDLAQTSTIYFADGKTVMAHFYEQNRTVVPLKKISEWVQQAVVAVEDKRFYEHDGVDLQGMIRAAVKNAAANGDIEEGASTLTQQYVKNSLIFAAQARGDKEAIEAARAQSYSRKLKEAKMALRVERTYTKDQILERYLNIAQFGPSQYGVEAAAQYYFGKPASKLNLPESATLAGITQSPNLNDPVGHPDKALERRNDILRLMYNQTMITRAQFDAAVATPMDSSFLHITPLPAGCQLAGDSAYFCDYVTRVILTDKTFGKTTAARKALLYTGGLNVVTTLDKAMETKARAALEKTIPKKDSSKVANALAAVEPGTGKILAMAQNRDYKVGSTNRYQTSVNYATDKPYGGSNGFQPGSTMKPFILTAWLKSGRSLKAEVHPMTNYDQKRWRCNGESMPGDEGDIQGRTSDWPALEATVNSSNTHYVSMIYDLDVCRITKNILEPMGVERADGGTWDSYPSMVLGTNNVSPLTMAAAYATFASGGTYCKPIAITSITNADGAAVAVPSAGCKQVLKPQITAGVTYALTQALARGTGASLGGIGRPAAGKTGTTDKNWHVWFVGYTPQIATAVWSGFPNKNKSLTNIVINGVYYAQAFGGTLPGKAWRDFMVPAHEGLPVKSFAKVSDTIMYGPRVQVPSVIGHSPSSAVAILEAAGFSASVDPVQQPFGGVSAGTVGSQSPGGGSMIYKGSAIRLVVSSGRPVARSNDSGGDNRKSDDKKNLEGTRRGVGHGGGGGD